MNNVFHSLSSDVNVVCAINVLKFWLERFQNMVSQKTMDTWAIRPIHVQMRRGIMNSHCQSNCRQFWKGVDRLTQERSVLR